MPNREPSSKSSGPVVDTNTQNQTIDLCDTQSNLTRTHIVKSLFRDLMGPKLGHEEITENPYGQYLVGILKPRPQKTKITEIDAITDSYERAQLRNKLPHGREHDFETSDEDFIIPADTDLNLMQGAHSLGLSFVVDGVNPIIHICCTWGTYNLISPNKYKRKTNIIVTKPITISEHRTCLLDNKTHSIYTVSEPGAEIYVYAHRIRQTHSWSISVFLLNNTAQIKSPTRKIQNNTQSFFQPQIRIICDSSTLADLGNSEQTENYLFQNKPIKGRGYLCGAMWKDVDPVRNLDNAEFLDVMWPDFRSDTIPLPIKKQFLCPDIRTEYFPMYVTPQPDTQSNTNLKFSANQLSEMWDPNTLKNTLLPIVNNYEAWISKLEQHLIKNLKTRADKQLNECRECANRIRDGINLIINDEKARLSFCFINKAIVTKNQWNVKTKSEFIWRTFQIAFILQTLPGLTIPGNKNAKEICDILWFPTGGGKTEAYVGLMLFTLAYRRLCSNQTFEMDGGVSVISRYTLRLLSLQQFRRTLDVVLSSEILRIQNWHPVNAVNLTDKELVSLIKTTHIWGENRFSIGLWVGDLTPNIFSKQSTPSKDILNAQGALLPIQKNRRTEAHGDPAQINTCPCCGTLLAIPQLESFKSDTIYTLNWIIKSDKSSQQLNSIPDHKFKNSEFELCKKNGNPAKFFKHITTNDSGSYYEMCVNFKALRALSPDKVDMWWIYTIKPALGINLEVPLQSTKASRPGYFFLYKKNSGVAYDFAIHCPNHKCPSWIEWSEKSQSSSSSIADPFLKSGDSNVSVNIPIPAFTTDFQIYARCPTVIIATTDKFAQLAFKPEAASIFGNVDSYHETKGFCRKHLLSENLVSITAVPKFYPPSLIIQDELHLIEGPLGSMVGLYELAIDALSSWGDHRPKYIASSATVKEASRQVGMVYRRDARVFPPNGVFDGDNHFSHIREDPTCVQNRPGRLYVGLLVTRGMLLGLSKLYASVLSSAYRCKVQGLTDVDPYWTLVGYFNAIRELAIAKSLYNSDILRDVEKLSSNEYFSTRHKKHSLSFIPATRLLPILLSENSMLDTITVYCSNNIGKISVALYASDSKTNKPSKLLSATTEPSVLSVKEGPNHFTLSRPLLCLKNTVVYVALHNYSSETKFDCGLEFDSYTIAPSTQKSGLIVFDTVSKYTIERSPIVVSVKTRSRDLDLSNLIELSSIVPSFELPRIMERLETPGSIDALFTTSIFGTGVDINRLGLMIVAGQPKSTASYVQSTGRIGRQHPGLVITWLRATRVRDLSHYENFVGYHRTINRFVEPISSAPFSEKALKTCLGPVLVAILRNASKIGSHDVSSAWANNPNYIIQHRDDNEVIALETYIATVYDNLKNRIGNLQLSSDNFKQISINAVDRWLNCAQRIARDGDEHTLEYSEPTFQKIQHHVVLGTSHHETADKISVYERARHSLRDVESMFTISENEEIADE